MPSSADKHERSANARDVQWFTSLSAMLDASLRRQMLERLEDGTGLPRTTKASDHLVVRLLDFYITRANSQSTCTATTSVLHKVLSGDATGEAAAATASNAAKETDRTTVAEAVRVAYRLTMRREPATKEVQSWQDNLEGGLSFPEFLLLMQASEEAQIRRAEETLLPDLADADFIQHVYRTLERRGAVPAEIEHFRTRIGNKELTRQAMLIQFFTAAIRREISGEELPLHDGLSCQIMGTGQTVTLDEWTRRSEDREAMDRARAALRPRTPFTLTGPRAVKVSAITSLFRGGDFIESFMDNMVSQTVFDDYCELLILDADSPENEAEVIARYLDDHPNIRYRRCDTRIGIYEAWNEGVKMSRGDYLTNANLDDLRRADSFEIQAGALEALPFVDVVYQDFYYSFDPTLDWEEVACHGYLSDVPVITPYNMMRFNSPHNAPMWRRTLHDELGLFDAGFKSAGDYEFWMRCLVAKKIFYKINEPHVVYYQNPKGLSTRADTRGVVEAREVMHRYAHKLIAPAFTMPLDSFAEKALGLPKEIRGACAGDRNLMAQAALRDLARKAKPALSTH